MSSKYTPGEWKTGSCSNTKYDVYQQKNGSSNRFIATTTMNHPDDDTNSDRIENEANARLMADAPEMLKELRSMVGLFIALMNGEVQDDHHASETARRATVILERHGG